MFLPGYLSFDVVVDSVLFWFGLVLGSEWCGWVWTLEQNISGFHTTDLNSRVKKGFYQVLVWHHSLRSHQRKDGEDPEIHLSCLFNLCPPLAAPSWNKELVTKSRSLVHVPVGDEKACLCLGCVNLCPREHGSDFYRDRKVVERSSVRLW